MQFIELNEWILKEVGGRTFKGALPGCNYLDLLKNNLIQDPFYGENEKKAKWVGERDWEYSADFEVPKAVLENEYVFLKISSPDTIVDIFINDTKAAHTRNCHMDYSIDVKRYLKAGKNSIRLYFYSPIKYIQKKQAKDRFPFNAMGISGFPHIRKPSYHFGWDWGPILPPSGVNGKIKIAYSNAYIEDAKILQTHFDNKVKLDIKADIVSKIGSTLSVKILDPNGELIYHKESLELSQSLYIQNPLLWQPNTFEDREEQPLYEVILETVANGKIEDGKSFKIGLRTIELDTSKDAWGENFAFLVNGKRHFMKGGNWIPSDSFITRTTDQKLENLIKNCKDANMNMIRVWGGGFYERDYFYELCDRHGILVWQDFMFACQPFPFYDPEFFELVKEEIAFNVKRLRHHACLALWCGNNEIEMINIAWRYKRKFIKAEKMFFYEFLPKYLREFDKDTPYWYSSPSGGKDMKNTNSDRQGDTHLWHVWHGLKPFEYYTKRFSRFCSEFGFESIPDIDTIRSFAEEKDMDLFSPVILSHQKCKSGNAKIIYYMCDNYSIPKSFFELIYISQLVQAESIRHAVEHWRRNTGRCNGALYWQLNDCWPTLSWSSMDYFGRRKALHYFAKRFFEPLTVSAVFEKNRFLVHIINDASKDFQGFCRWRLMSLKNTVFRQGEIPVDLKSLDKIMVEIEKENGIKIDKKTMFLNLKLFDKDKKELSSNNLFFCRINKLDLEKAKIEYDIKRKGDKYTLELKANAFCKNVFLHLKDQVEAFSDNFFDLLKDEIKTVSFSSPKEIAEIKKELKIICYNNVQPKYPRFRQRLIKLKISCQPINLMNRIIYKFV
ncbi:MAG: glycoside hydrolase family 2 protein [Clostridia bacterium]|jgi:beta-mannosidase